MRATNKAKITTMIKSGAIIRVRIGLYVQGQANSYPLKTLANRIYGHRTFHSSMHWRTIT